MGACAPVALRVVQCEVGQVMRARDRYHRREVVKAVHDDDLKTLLQSLGMLEKVLAGNVPCAICSRLLSLSTIGCIYPQHGEIKLTCDSAVCCAGIAKLRQ